METQFYQGYPKWRKTDYQEQKEILQRLISPEDFDQYNKQENVSTSF